jgi:hypothetical protein
MNVDPVIAGAVAGVLLGLQGWTLQQMVGVKVKLARLETILGRLPCERKCPAECPAEETKER